MADTLPSPAPARFTTDDGVEIAWRTLGAGSPVLLIHGLFSNAETNWIRYGHAQRLVEAGFRVILPDLRGHGASGAPHDAAHYPPDILAHDMLQLVRHLGLEAGNYDLGGYSLGGRTAMRMLVLGARPRRAVVAGMGLQGLLAATARSDHFRTVLTGLGQHRRGSPEWFAEAFLKTTGGDPRAMLPLIDSFVDTPAADLAAIDRPVLVIAGEKDADNGSAEALAELLPQGRYLAIPGNHMSAVTEPALGQGIAAFLAR